MTVGKYAKLTLEMVDVLLVDVLDWLVDGVLGKIVLRMVRRSKVGLDVSGKKLLER